MSGSRSANGAEQRNGADAVVPERTSSFVFGGFWAILFLSTFVVAGPWAGFHAVLLGSIGLLGLLRPPAVALPRSWWIFAALFVVLGCGAFLPTAWFGVPEWRVNLESLGVQTGSMVAVQARQAVEAFGLFVITLFIGLWLAGHRPSSSQLRMWTMVFVIGVAFYAIISKLKYDPRIQLYGFFPNRNHTATYLAMGTICGLGNVLQALRERRFLAMSLALVATVICIWAVAGWSISRGGVVLVVVGGLLWIPMLGRHYLGQHGLRALALIGLAGAGLFFIADSAVKDRISKTVEKAGNLIGPSERAEVDGKPTAESTNDLDFRIPTALDTLDLIREFKWTGIGAGQFFYVFPQYRRLTSVSNDSDSYHPESDWLWMGAEVGIPATLALAALVFVGSRTSLRSLLGGRDRALRSGCLVAALLLPIHGVFDVPGHRIVLALSAAFLFALSLRVPYPDGPSSPQPGAWPFRLAALLVLGVAFYLGHVQWKGGRPPAILAGQIAGKDVVALLEEDHRRQDAIQKSGQTSSPLPSEGDPLERALTELDQEARALPLQRNIQRLRGVVALHFDDKDELARRAFAIERTLHPTRVNVAFDQAKAWSSIDPAEAVTLWREALARAARLDGIQPDTQWSEEKTRQRILAEIRSQPHLEALWNSPPADKKPE